MERNLSHQELEYEWDRAAELAQDNQTSATPSTPPDHESLDRAAGLQIKSGVQAGDWEIPISAAC